MLLFYGVGSAWRLRGEAGNESKSMRGAEQVSRYVKPCFMPWSLTAKEGVFGKDRGGGSGGLQIGVTSVRCRHEYNVHEMLLPCFKRFAKLGVALLL
jgi:hypothetical protein